MMMLMMQGGRGVKNWPKVDDVIYGRSPILKLGNKTTHLNFLRGTVLGDKEQGIGIRVSSPRVNGQGIRDNG